MDDLNEPSLYRDIILLYCPPKVGSTSLVSSFRMSGTDQYFVMHTHDEIIFKSNSGELNDTTVTDIIGNTCVKNTNTNMPRKIFLIDIYRSPVEQKISEYFHEMDTLHFNNYQENICNYSLLKIIKRFNDIFPYISNYDYFKDKFGLTAEEIPETFDHDKKYALVEKNGVTYIKLRLKDSECWGGILSGIFGRKINIIKDHETKNKKIGELFKLFKEKFVLPFNYFQLIEKCPQLQYYYSFDERFEYLKEWYQKTTGFYVSILKAEYAFYQKICIENQHIFRKLTEHYKDDGCLCMRCTARRVFVLRKINNNEIEDINILHNAEQEKYEGPPFRSINSIAIKKIKETLTEDRFIILSLML